MPLKNITLHDQVTVGQGSQEAELGAALSALDGATGDAKKTIPIDSFKIILDIKNQEVQEAAINALANKSGANSADLNALVDAFKTLGKPAKDAFMRCNSIDLVKSVTAMDKTNLSKLLLGKDAFGKSNMTEKDIKSVLEELSSLDLKGFANEVITEAELKTEMDAILNTEKVVVEAATLSLKAAIAAKEVAQKELNDLLNLEGKAIVAEKNAKDAKNKFKECRKAYQGTENLLSQLKLEKLVEASFINDNRDSNSIDVRKELESIIKSLKKRHEAGLEELNKTNDQTNTEVKADVEEISSRLNELETKLLKLTTIGPAYDAKMLKLSKDIDAAEAKKLNLELIELAANTAYHEEVNISDKATRIAKHKAALDEVSSKTAEKKAAEDKMSAVKKEITDLNTVASTAKDLLSQGGVVPSVGGGIFGGLRTAGNFTLSLLSYPFRAMYVAVRKLWSLITGNPTINFSFWLFE